MAREGGNTAARRAFSHPTGVLLDHRMLMRVLSCPLQMIRNQPIQCGAHNGNLMG